LLKVTICSTDIKSVAALTRIAREQKPGKMMMEHRTHQKRTFSRLELAIVIAFLLILAAITIPNAAF